MKKKLLLVVDMQNDFVDGALGTEEAQSIVPTVLDKMESWDGVIMYTQDTHGENYLQTQEGGNLPIEHCIKGTVGWQLQPQILHFCVEHRVEGVEKVTFGAKKLPALLKTKYPDGLSEICVIGLCTDICVISNVLLLKAFFPETPITVDASCCAGVTPDSHMTALRAMQACQINIE